MEALCLFVMAGVFSRNIKNNRLFWYLCCYSILRFLLEFGRADDRGILFVDWLSPAQVTSILIWAGLGINLLVKNINKVSNHRKKVIDKTAHHGTASEVDATDYLKGKLVL